MVRIDDPLLGIDAGSSTSARHSSEPGIGPLVIRAPSSLRQGRLSRTRRSWGATDGLGFLHRTGVPRSSTGSTSSAARRSSRSDTCSLTPCGTRTRRSRSSSKGLQDQIKDQGLWAIFLDEELGGPGYGQLKLGLLNEIIGRYPTAPQMFGAAAPDTGNMEMLAAYGTEEQKERWLKPMLNQEMWSAYSMTEPQGGSDPNLFKTHAERDGDEWVINGEKWFTSAGRVADILFVMCTNGMFVVPRRRLASRSSPSRATTTTSSTATCVSRSTICSVRKTVRRCSRSAGSAAVVSTTRCARSRSASWRST